MEHGWGARVWSEGVVDDVIKKNQNSPIELKIAMETKFDMDIMKYMFSNNNGGGWANYTPGKVSSQF